MVLALDLIVRIINLWGGDS